ncbi:YciI family protein [Leucobacter japonicus]|uniref:YciI family protein n=1 Tax=Leucobacter japonicus TaxID=1461259 RepID=UPI0006A7645F|nr:YciI family protein [Leucobacter japonicus]
MQFMLIMRATDEALAAAAEVPFTEMIERVGRFNEAMIEAGVMAGGGGLAPAEEGRVVDFSTTPPTIIEGGYGTTESRFNGYWIIDVPTIDDAAEWAARAPLDPGNQLEVRRIPGADEFPEDNEWVQKEKEWIEQGQADAH